MTTQSVTLGRGASGSIRTLVVDDSQPMLESILRLLSCHVEVEVIGTASNGAEAVELAKKTRPDLILMDIQMPCLSGIEASRTLREWAPELRIILITSQGELWAGMTGAVNASAVISKARLPELLPALLTRLFP